jgi:phage/plasmid-like protein (TIGR03299 family)
MAHEIRSNDSLVLARTAAWHGLGQILPDTVTPAEALTIGRLDWTVEESTSLTATFVANDGAADRTIVETHKSLRRSDDKSLLSTVGADYSVLQNQTLAEIATSLGAQGSARVETAGSLFGGRKVFFLLHTNTLDIGRKGDTVEQYILLANAHDGTMSATAMPTSVRVVCANTLTMALGYESKAAYRWRHTSGLALRVDDIKAALATYSIAAKAEAKAMDALAAKPLTRDEIQSLWTDVLVALDGPIAKNPKTEQESRRRQKAVDALADMTRVFDREAADFGATAWVAANAATNYIQYHRGYLKGDARVNADLFGSYGDAKRTVMTKALALV